MGATLALSAAWDLEIDASGNIAVLAEPDSLAQDAASAIKTFLGEYFWDVTIGVPWLQQILGQAPTLALLKQQLVDAALTVPDVVSAQVFISSFNNRAVFGQVQVVGPGGQTSAANFAVTSLTGNV